MRSFSSFADHVRFSAEVAIASPRSTASAAFGTPVDSTPAVPALYRRSHRGVVDAVLAEYERECVHRRVSLAAGCTFGRIVGRFFRLIETGVGNEQHGGSADGQERRERDRRLAAPSRAG